MMKLILGIVAMIISCNGVPISEWIANTLTKERMSGGSISGYYNGTIWSLSPFLYGHSTGITLDVKTQKIRELTNDYPAPKDYFMQSVPNAFTTIDEYIYFIANNGETHESPTYLNAFSMKYQKWADHKHQPLYKYTTFTTLPCLTSTLNGKYLILMGGIKKSSSSSSSSHSSSSHSSSSSASASASHSSSSHSSSSHSSSSSSSHSSSSASDEVIFIDIKSNKWVLGPSMNAPSHSFGCMVASNGYLYKFGGSNYHHHDDESDDNVQGWKLNVNGDIDNIKHNHWEKVYVDLPDSPQNPTILEHDKLLYIIGGKSQETGNCVKTVTYVNISDHAQYDDNYKPPQLIDAYCYGAGISVQQQLYLFGGTQIENGHITMQSVPIWQETIINNTISPTIKPTDKPTTDPTTEPTKSPTDKPTMAPTAKPTKSPTTDPTKQPTQSPTYKPTVSPTIDPTAKPTESPTADPSKEPTESPTDKPTNKPTPSPTADPTKSPTTDPTKEPTQSPTDKPTTDPTAKPSVSPTTDPTKEPTESPTDKPTADPTNKPSKSPTNEPTADPTTDGSASSTHAPSTNWIIIGCSLGAALLLFVIAIYCVVKRYKSRIKNEALL